MRRWMWLLSALLLADCTTLSDVRHLEPTQAITVQGQRKAITDCLADELRLKISADDDPYDVIVAERDGKALIEGRIASSEPYYAWEVSLVQQGVNVRVEIRSRRNIWGNLMYSDRHGSLLHKCAASTFP